MDTEQALADLASFLQDVAETIAPMMVEARVHLIAINEHSGRAVPDMQGPGRVLNAEDEHVFPSGHRHTLRTVGGVRLLRVERADVPASTGPMATSTSGGAETEAG